MNLVLVLVIVLLVLAVGGLPQVGVMQWGYGPSGALGVVLVVVLVLLLLGRL